MKWQPEWEFDHRRDDLISAALAPPTRLTALTTMLNAVEHIISGPRARAPTATVTKNLLDRYRRQMAGYFKEAAEQAAQQIARDITAAPPGQVQRSGVRDAGVEQDASEAVIRETLLDFLENTFKLLVPEILPAIMPPKEGEQPAPEPGEQKTQPERIGIPNRGAETLFRRDNEQAVPNRVAELERQLAETRREKAKLERQLAERDHQLAEVQANLVRHTTVQVHQRELANERQKLWRERNLEEARARDAARKREKRARQRGQRSS